MQETYLKIKNETQQDIRINVKWAQNSFHLIALYAGKAYRANVTENEIETQAKVRNIEFTSYYNNLKEFLTDPKENISFSLKNGRFSILHCGQLTSKHFVANIEEKDYRTCIEELLDEVKLKHNETCKKLYDVEKVNKATEEELKKHQELMEQFIEGKDEYENKLMGAFHMLLNEKKDHIKKLNLQIEKLQSQEDVGHIKETVSSSGSEQSDGYDTEEEKRSHGAKLMKLSENEAINVKVDPELPSTSNIFLEDSPPPPAVPRRNNKLMKASTSKAEQLFLNSTLDLEEKNCIRNTDNKPEGNVNRGKSCKKPEYSTQDLLDRL